MRLSQKTMIKFSGLEPDKDIPIVFTEPRPGEKLFEEILTAEEGTVATQNKKIFIAKLSSVNPGALDKKIEELKEAAQSGKKENVSRVLKEIIPTFVAANNL